MIVFRDPAEIPPGFGPSVVAIGKFDGVHTGHRAVIDRARVDAASGARVVAVTFDRNPLRLLRPELSPPDLIGVHQKLSLLERAGVDATLLLTFDEALASLTAEEFVRHVLVQALGVRTVLVGQDFRFGKGGAGNPALLRTMGAEYGFRVDVVDDVRAIDDDRRVSSTWIRELLAEGDVARAAKLLGRAPSVWGEVVHGLKRGRELGFPTANLSPRLEGFVPADGVYAGWLIDERSQDGLRSGTRYAAAISVGLNPTFDDVPVRQVEAYVLDETDLDLYGHLVEVRFVTRIRGMVAFDGIDALKAQMTDDVARVRAVLAEPQERAAQ
ncbi:MULTISPECIES: bifunctional riboflavin kinase/FAD synthetase [Microbacterium]|uniref:Riboflavin biosynthesis protein n=1 Tax=Microbacterium wangchenii TaxID=2541726 RepID=A0ABX5SQ51_9MICO|nr:MULTISPECIES: bifunctional riboflavin kinase/FAD synthetase [Microbacterium]MCK6066980.1 bifunctional riboflavin kinase/FAD synthetase [Microbacterium sp. EYE_512]QBR88276.1 bifunctional riboflavin kinase/FAD synthetase [Microbacterium wangchenii]TFV83603.1 bifunctional riboflavin kinase/FAD synthetase [Microbacterium sp. dk485]TXK17934.1 bifunctional riboflavin kinase/FAD synthetase [Microbacterium wangchenii]